MFNLYAYSIYSLEIWRPGLVWSSRHPQHIGGFKLPEGKHCYGLTSPLGAWGHLVHTQSPVPSSDFSQRKWTQEHENCFVSQTSMWQVGMREGFTPKLHKLHHCHRCGWSHPLKRTHLLGCSVSYSTCNLGLNDCLLMNHVAVFPTEPACRTAFSM